MPRKGMTRSEVVTTPSAQSEKAMPLNGTGCSGEAIASNGFREAKAKIQCPPVLGVLQTALLLPGYSSQKPPRSVPAKTFRSAALPPWGRAKSRSGPGPNDSRSTTLASGGVVGRTLGGGTPPPPPPLAAKVGVATTTLAAKTATILIQ